MVLLLHWKAFYDQDDSDTSSYTINIAKNRNGRTGEYKLSYTPKYYRFTEDVDPNIRNIRNIFDAKEV